MFDSQLEFLHTENKVQKSIRITRLLSDGCQSGHLSVSTAGNAQDALYLWEY